ncbi:hypothetical protein Aduo_018624 [Ancylostoma duodenale]
MTLDVLRVGSSLRINEVDLMVDSEVPEALWQRGNPVLGPPGVANDCCARPNVLHCEPQKSCSVPSSHQNEDRPAAGSLVPSKNPSVTMNPPATIVFPLRDTCLVHSDDVLRSSQNWSVSSDVPATYATKVLLPLGYATVTEAELLVHNQADVIYPEIGQGEYLGARYVGSREEGALLRTTLKLFVSTWADRAISRMADAHVLRSPQPLLALARRAQGRTKQRDPPKPVLGITLVLPKLFEDICQGETSQFFFQATQGERSGCYHSYSTHFRQMKMV